MSWRTRPSKRQIATWIVAATLLPSLALALNPSSPRLSAKDSIVYEAQLKKRLDDWKEYDKEGKAPLPQKQKRKGDEVAILGHSFGISGCLGSACILSGCLGSACILSGCGVSVCLSSACGATGCVVSVCGGNSVCAASICGGNSVCFGSMCSGNSVCQGSHCGAVSACAQSSCGSGCGG